MTTPKERPAIGQTPTLSTAQAAACAAIFAMFQARERYIHDKTPETHAAWRRAERERDVAYAALEAVRERVKEVSE